jgi:hypothetical protein
MPKVVISGEMVEAIDVLKTVGQSYSKSDFGVSYAIQGMFVLGAAVDERQLLWGSIHFGTHQTPLQKEVTILRDSSSLQWIIDKYGRQISSYNTQSLKDIIEVRLSNFRGGPDLDSFVHNFDKLRLGVHLNFEFDNSPLSSQYSSQELTGIVTGFVVNIRPRV